MRGTVRLTVWPAALTLALLMAVPGSRSPWLQNAASAHPGWTVVADSQETSAADGAAFRAIDGDPATFWRSRFTGGEAALPHTLTVDTGQTGPVAGVVLTPRQDDTPDGNIGRFRVQVSTNGTWWRTVASGLLADSTGTKTVQFPLVSARYVRVTALSEAGGRGPMTTLAELSLLTSAPAAPTSGTGRWSLPFNLPLVPVSAAMLNTGKVLLWSSYRPDAFGKPNEEVSGRTLTATYDPSSTAVSQRTVTNTGHDMFCPGTALLPDGTLLVNGGSTDGKTSLFNPKTGVWSAGADLIIKRGYQAAVTTSQGAVFTLGGSWNDSAGAKNGELWTAAGGSQLLPDADVTPSLTQDTGGVFRQDNHAWLFAASQGMVFHAGPSQAMGWYDTAGTGTYTAAGARADDSDAMNGNAVMYDVGKILAAGGSPNYSGGLATNHAYTIDISQGPGVLPTVVPLAGMNSPRTFATSVVLPSGQVLEVGGQDVPAPYFDGGSILKPELFDPATGAFTVMAPMQIPRNYHSIALLLSDGRVLAAGGGLCGTTCTDPAANHPDAEIFTPPYLLTATGAPAPRPGISTAPTTATVGSTIQVRTTRAVTAFSLVRMASVTHGINNDQRRVPLTFTPPATGTTYALTLPNDRGVLVPGAYMLFALDAKGVPSTSRIVTVS